MRPQPAHAQLVVACPLCSNAFQQYAQLAQAIIQVSYAAKQYSTMLQNLWTLGSANWSNPAGDISQIQSLLSQGNLLTAQISPIISRLQSAAAENNLALTLPANFQSQIAQWQGSLANSSQAVQRQLQAAPQLQSAGAINLANAQADMANAQGNLQALQALGEITGQLADTTLQEHDTIIAMLQSMQTQFATQNERTAVLDQQTANFLAPPLAHNLLTNAYSASGP